MCCGVKYFCCKRSLEEGAITSVIVTTLLSLSMLAFGGQILGNLNRSIDEIILEGHIDVQDKHIVRKTLIATGVMLLMEGLMGILISMSLTIALFKKLAGFVLFYLVGAMVIIVFGCISDVLFLLTKTFWMLLHVAFLAFYSYLWVVVYNYYRSLSEDRIEHQRTYIH